ncbi:alkaline phosphatase family protein [bacterium]|nr:alkaline phosphatase family protein [bacterium]
MTTRKLLPLIFYISILLGLAACQADWEIGLTVDGESVGAIQHEEADFYLDKSEEETEAVLMDQFLFNQGFRLITDIVVSCDDGQTLAYVWDDVAGDAVLTMDGEFQFGDDACQPVSIELTPSEAMESIELWITDLAPTIAQSLGLPELPDAIGTPQQRTKAVHAVLIVIDGTQYDKLMDELAAGNLPYLASQSKVYKGLTVYPSVTTASSASLLTGALPDKTQVYGHGFRTTELTTLFDLAVENGLTVHAVEGSSLPFNLRNTEITLSGDRDQNGYSDDNVFTNTLDVIETGLPNVLYVHFHEIDDMGHSYGPYSSEYLDAMIRVDGYLEGIVEALPEHTLIIITADHGMHETDDGGNHGTLAANDMQIPIIFIEK